VRTATLCLALLLLAAPALAGNASKPVVQPGQSCPLTTAGAYTARVLPPAAAPVAGRPFTLTVALDPPQPPAGFFVSTLVNVLEAPPGEKPRILTGFPDISLNFPSPGGFKLEVTVTLIAKSSCGGVKARELVRRTLDITVLPADPTDTSNME